jgi:chromosome condensin MukBEF complex kleisin-like MukF subunit
MSEEGQAASGGIAKALRSVDEERQNAEPWTVEMLCKEAADTIDALERRVRELEGFLSDTADALDAMGKRAEAAEAALPQANKMREALRQINQRFVDMDMPGHELAVIARAALASQTDVL